MSVIEQDRRRLQLKSWADRHQLAIGFVLVLIGLAAISAIRFLGLKGSLAMMFGGLAAFALLFGRGFLWNRGPIFPPSEINRENRWKYLTVAALLWLSVLLAWWFLVRPLKSHLP
jgi:hypothetical protein